MNEFDALSGWKRSRAGSSPRRGDSALDRLPEVGSGSEASTLLVRVALAILLFSTLCSSFLAAQPTPSAEMARAAREAQEQTAEGQRAEGQREGETTPTGGFQSGVGRLIYGNGESALPYSITLTGDMFALQPLVDRLGGTLTVGPLGLGYTLDLFGETVIIGPDSPVMTKGDEIIPLSRAPLKEINGLMVPLDFLRRTWGEMSGVSFTWTRSTRTLFVDRRVGRELEVQLDLVHIAGVTTLVLRFADDPSYRFEETRDGFELIFPGDQLLLRGPIPRSRDMIRDLLVEQDRVRVLLAPGAKAATPYRVDRGSVQLIVEIAPGGTVVDIPRPRLEPERRGTGMRIVLDPGHGGTEVGAVGTKGTLEKDLTMDLAQRLRRSLEGRLPVRVLMTRESDVAVPLEQRTAMANQYDADLFISLHMNSVPGGGGNGAETYFLNLEASDRRAEEAARIENASGSGGSGVELMLWDLAQSNHMAASQAFARLVQKELNEALGLRDRGVKQAPFTVLIGATMPAVLVEFGFLSNPDEEAKLQRADYQAELVEAIVRAVTIFREQRRRSVGGDQDLDEDGQVEDGM